MGQVKDNLPFCGFEEKGGKKKETQKGKAKANKMAKKTAETKNEEVIKKKSSWLFLFFLL